MEHDTGFYSLPIDVKNYIFEHFFHPEELIAVRFISSWSQLLAVRRQPQRGRFAVDLAVRTGSIPFLEWVINNFKYQNQVRNVCCLAAFFGHFHVLKWARARSYTWNEGTCCGAAEGGHLETLKWAREAGCPWNADTFTAAARKGHLEILQWARGNGCPCNNIAVLPSGKSEKQETMIERHPDIRVPLPLNLTTLFYCEPFMPYLHLEQLYDVSGRDFEFETELIAIWSEQTTDSLAKLKKAIIDNDRSRFSLYASDLRGSAANIGAELMRRRVRALSDLESNNLKATEELLKAVVSAAELTVLAMRMYCQAMRACT